ncbi:hypothetical protein [Pseudarthrobacter equi]|uniref:hypothetical protein n=1 Tax=Pseudarthrobacter equi TaxID=728066 RepID=UPI0028D48BCD|nr:hypothetical protein [Pseudarthrobacter equi]
MQEFDRNGDPKTHPSFPSIKLPCCVECNGGLNKHFETHKLLVQGLFKAPEMMSDKESDEVSLWLLKTTMLLSHPETKWDLNSSQDFKQELAKITAKQWHQAPKELYHWLSVDGNGTPPPFMSLYLHRFDDASEPMGALEVALPEVRTQGDVFKSLGICFRLKNLGLTLIYHPGWKFKLWGGAEDNTFRVWPDPEPLRVNTLQPRSDWPVAFRETASVDVRASTWAPADTDFSACLEGENIFASSSSMPLELDC